MLWNASDRVGYEIQATDGVLGSVESFLFDDQDWTIRWLQIDAGSWLSQRQVLLPPSAVREPDLTRRAFATSLSKQQVEDSPSIDTDAPVSRQNETDIYGYYGWDPYWSAYAVAPAGVATPIEPSPNVPGTRPGVEQRVEGDPHLRSTREVTGYYVNAADDDIGHVEDFLLDSEAWTIRYVVVDTRNWWPGKKVLMAPHAFTNINWADGTIETGLMRDQVRNGPEYDPSATVDRAYEERYFSYYGYPPYW